MKSDEIEIRTFGESDLSSAMQLKDLAGWNQTVQDWRRFLRLNPAGCFAALSDGKMAATTTVVTYEKELAWIGMVLVAREHRRRGVATKLMKTALAYSSAAQVSTVKLDATSEGKSVYENLGFEVELLIERWTGTASTRSTPASSALWRNSLLTQLIEFDRRAFGADRAQLLQLLIADSCCAPSIRLDAGGRLRGYALARPGTRAQYVGPIVALESETAFALLDEMSDKLAGAKIYLDVNTTFGVTAGELRARGFSQERDLIRMRRGEQSAAGTSGAVFAIAGPEIG